MVEGGEADVQAMDGNGGDSGADLRADSGADRVAENGADSTGGAGGSTVSLRAEVPEPLLQAMAVFIESHPNWDQYRLFQAALAGFLVQQGVQDREVTRCYLANLFPSQRRFADAPHRPGTARGGTVRASRPAAA